MPRTDVKSEAYFDAFIEFELETIANYGATLSQPGIDPDKADRLRPAVLSASIHALVAMFSRGDSRDALQAHYLTLLHGPFRYLDYPGMYVQLLWILSIGIALDVDDAALRIVQAKMDEHGIEDGLLDLLLALAEVSSRRSQGFEFDKPFSFLSGVETLPQDEAVARLSTYLKRRWYPGMQGCYWHNSHKSKADTFFGYWCFEARALAKLLDLDDTALRKSKYYPGDL